GPGAAPHRHGRHARSAAHGRQGPQAGRAGPVGQHGHRPRLDRPRVQPGRHPRLRRPRRRRPRAGDVPARLRADAAGGRGLPGAEPGRPRLRDDLHLGHQGLRPVGRVDRGLGPRGLGDHRAGQRRRDRRRVQPVLPRPRLPGRGPGGQGAARHRRHRGHDPGQLPGHRALRAGAERAGDRAAGGARAAQRGGAVAGLRRRRRPAGRAAQPAVVLPAGPERLGDRRGRDPLRLHLLGLGRLPRRRGGDPGRRLHARQGRGAGHGGARGHLPAGRGRRPGLRRLRRERHRAEQPRQLRRRALRARRAGAGAGDGRGPAAHRGGLGGGVDADDDPPLRPRGAVDGRVRRAARAVRPGAPALPHPRLRHPGDGRGVGVLLRRAVADQRRHPRRLDRQPGPRGGLLLRRHRVRVRLVLPPHPDRQPAEPAPARGAAAARRPGDGVGVPRLGARHDRRRLRLHGDRRARRGVRHRRRHARARPAADARLLRLAVAAPVLPRRHPGRRDPGAGAGHRRAAARRSV
ncbi:MAG: Uncharacterized amino acid permease, GabP family, partial [uncultured Quadrisphaera sp.]